MSVLILVKSTTKKTREKILLTAPDTETMLHMLERYIEGLCACDEIESIEMRKADK